MAHYSYPSPDRKWALVVEMDPQWHPCRLVPFSGGSLGKQVGPSGACTSAAWSPDGNWMYFGVEVDGKRHLWRQSFPDGRPEQMTSGPTEEDGLAVAPDGRSLITSISTKQNAIWIHDSRGDHAVSTEGYASGSPPGFRTMARASIIFCATTRPSRPANFGAPISNPAAAKRSCPVFPYANTTFRTTKKRWCSPPSLPGKLPNSGWLPRTEACRHA